MTSPEPLRYDATAKKYYRLTPGPGGEGIRSYVDSTSIQLAPTLPSPRTSSRANPLAIPQNPNIPQPRTPGPAVPSQQPSSPSQTRRTFGHQNRPGGSGGGSPHRQPFEPFESQRPPNRYTHSAHAPQREPAQRLASGLEHLNITDTGPNVISQDSHRSPPTPRTYPSPVMTQPMQQGLAVSHPRSQGQVSQDLMVQSQGIWPETGPDVNVQMSGEQNYRPAASPYLDTHPYPRGYVPNLRQGQAPDIQPSYPSVAPQPPPRTRNDSVTAPTGNADKQRVPAPTSIGQYRKNVSVDEETVEENVSEYMVRGTEGFEEPLDPNFRIVDDHWKFFVFGRVFMMLWWEPQGHGKTAGKSSNSIQRYENKASKYGEIAFAKVYRYVVLRPRPKQGYSMCLRISTHAGRGAVQWMHAQSESSIIYTGERAPDKLPGETNLRKDPINVVPIDDSLRLDPVSRIHYAKPYPVEHNVKVREVGMVAEHDLRKLWGYYHMESGHATETQKEPRGRQRTASVASGSRDKERRDLPRRER